MPVVLLAADHFEANPLDPVIVGEVGRSEIGVPGFSQVSLVGEHVGAVT
jgi:hypothetical protein